MESIKMLDSEWFSGFNAHDNNIGEYIYTFTREFSNSKQA
jgi:hypothetical protein